MKNTFKFYNTNTSTLVGIGVITNYQEYLQNFKNKSSDFILKFKFTELYEQDSFDNFSIEHYIDILVTLNSSRTSSDLPENFELDKEYSIHLTDRKSIKDLYQELVDPEIVEKLQKMYIQLAQDQPEDGYYHLYYGEDGPFSTGNYDDCYNSGYEAGVYEGKLDILKMLFEK